MAVIVADGAPRAGLELVSDFTLERGDAVVDLAHGTLDARVGASLQRARAALAEGAA
jgi:flagellar biosynthesis/type III secretory pathway protein FliH